MKESRGHLPGDLKALGYLDALKAGDLEAVAALWEEATDDPELERMLTEIDEAMFQEIPGNRSSVSVPPRRRHRRWAVLSGAAGTLAAACLLGILAWPPRNTENQGSILPISPAGKELAHQSPDVSRELTSLLEARRNPDESAMPGFAWPLDNVLSASTRLDLLD